MIKLALLAALLLAASFASVQAWRIHRRRERVRATETTAIADCRPGFREVVGRVVPGEETLSPYLLKPCVWCAWTVEERRKSGKSSSWVTVAEGKTAFPFDVDDGTGRIRVDPSGAEPHLMADAKAGMGTFDDPTPDLERFLKLVGVDPTALFGFNRKLRVTERVLAAGDEVYVLGPVEDGPNGLEFAAMLDEEFLITDRGEEELVARLGRQLGTQAVLVGVLLGIAVAVLVLG